MKNKISIIEIAALANVSIATVSRVTNRKGGYTRETEEKVLDIVKKYNYKQNVNAKSLRTRRSQTIGVIVPDISNEFFAKVIQSIEKHAIKYGYLVFVCNTDENIEIEERHLTNLMGRLVDGIIYVGGNVIAPMELRRVDIPIVYIDRYVDDKSLYVESDNFKGGYMAAEELVGAGCKKIAIIKDARTISSANQRYLGFLEALKKAKIKVDPELIKDIEKVGYKEAYEKTLELINEKKEFDGVFATNDAMALGVMMALNKKGINIPKDVKLIGFDNISATEISAVPITTISQDTEKIGEKAVELILNKILLIKDEVKNVKIPVELIKRKSTSCE